MNPLLLNDQVQDYLKLHIHTPLTRFVLMGSPFNGIQVQELAQQLEGQRRAKEKIPRWHKTAQIYFPPKLNIEQTSSETAARYKAALINADTVADLTGGLGIDSFYFAQRAKEVCYYEQDPALAEIATHNFKCLNAFNISVHTGDAIEKLSTAKIQFDLIYADPSRRDDTDQKVFMLRDCEPNIPENLTTIFAHTATLMIKSSPLLDITLGIDQLQHVATIHIVAIKNEVKEILFILKSQVDTNVLDLVTVNINGEKIESTHCDYKRALRAAAHYSQPQVYLYEPNAALMKSGLFSWISSTYKVNKLAVNSHLYTSDKKVDFPGRVFEIQTVLPYNKKNILKTFGGSQANIKTRNFRESVAQLRKRYKIKDGGDNYLFFTTGTENESLVIACKKIK